MKTWVKSIICISLSLMCLFTCVGYAALTKQNSIIGTTKIDIPYGLFITNVVVQGSNNLNSSGNSCEALPHSTSLDSTVSKKNNTEASITYRVTVFNNTKITYSYRKLYYQTNLEGYGGNDVIDTRKGDRKIFVDCSLANASAEEKKVDPGKYLTFTVTYTFGRRLSGIEACKTLINYQFGINVDGEREALEVVEDKFLNILNTTSTYLQLIDALDNKFDGVNEWTSNYIGNVTGSSSEDSMAVNTLFAGQLQITVGKEQLDATVLIKHENLDWNNYTGDDYVAVHSSGREFRGYGCEMTLYLTIDPLNMAGAYVPVYAVVFTCDRDYNGNKISDWYRIGSTYAGTANVVTYDGGNGTGSFVTDNWRADAATYELIEGYSYNLNGEVYELAAYSHAVASGVSIKDIVVAQDASAVRTFQTLLNHAKRIVDSPNYAGVGIEIAQEVYDKYADLYTVDANGNHTVDSNLTIAQLSPAILDTYRAVNEALTRIDEAIKKNG